MKRLKKLLLAAVPLVLLAGCGTTGTPQAEAPAQEAVDQPVAAVVTPAPMDTGFQGHPLDDPESLLAMRVIYFDYDKSDIMGKSRDIIAAHARYLASHPAARITLEGHTDERGSREYNMGLGENRGNAVRKFLMLQGASGRQVEVVSYGEERPAAFGHVEASWVLNRRAEIAYQNR